MRFVYEKSQSLCHEKKLFAFAIMASICSFGQIKIDNIGHIGLASLQTDPNALVFVESNSLETGINVYGVGRPEFTKCFSASLDATNQIGYEVNSGGNSTWYVMSGGWNWSAIGYTTGSDQRFKTNISRIENPLLLISNLSGYTYTMSDFYYEYYGIPRDSSSIESQGVLAQEVQEIIPAAVTQDENGYLGVNYDQLIPVLIV